MYLLNQILLNKLKGENMNNLGIYIKQCRINNGFKQKDFSKLCEISQAYLSRIENSKEYPSIELLEKISSNLNKPLSVILFMSISEKDVKPEKTELWKVVSPAIKDLIDIIWS